MISYEINTRNDNGHIKMLAQAQLALSVFYILKYDLYIQISYKNSAFNFFLFSSDFDILLYSCLSNATIFIINN